MKSLSVNIPESRINQDSKSDDEQLDQLLDTPSSSIYEVCQCCGRPDCENLDYFTQLIKKLESDTRLAAEIGQSLLNKHENYVNESNKQRSVLEKQLEEYQEKNQALESSLDNVENDKSEIIKEKNKWHWEYQKRQKILNETISDLETANDKCNQLSSELETKTSELEKLRIFKFMARHSESREEALTTKLEDTNQELAICRKNELLLESKNKKLKTKYENLCNSHEKLLRDFEDRMKSALTVNNHRNTTHTITNNSNSDTTKQSTNDLIDLIKELSLANTKLKLDLMNCKDQLSESKGEIAALNQKIEDMNETAVPPQDNLSSFLTNSRRSPTVEAIPIRTNTMQHPPMPTISSSMPTFDNDPSAVHHHFHYYKKNNKGEYIQITDEMDTQSSDGEHDKDKAILLSPTFKDDTATKSPYMMLLEHVTQVLERLRGSDIRTLNRRLKRAFDITELSSMSNSIIDNIIMELETLESRFVWVKSNKDDSDLTAFFPLLALLKDMLKELGVIKSTMNELQVEYVKKVEESEVRVEEEIRRKRQLKKKTTVTIPESPFSWITSMFSTKSSVPETLVQSPEDDERHFFRNDHARIQQYGGRATIDQLRRQPVMSKSTSTGTSRSIPIQNKKGLHRINIDYEGIGPASIRPIPSERDNGSDFSSSWLGGK